MTENYEVRTAIESALEQGIHYLDGQFGPRKVWREAQTGASMDDILQDKGPSEVLFQDDPEMQNCPAVKALDRFSFSRGILKEVGKSEDQDRVEEDLSYLFVRRGLIGCLIVGYEVDAGKDLNVQEDRINEILRDKRNYDEHLQISVNTDGNSLHDLYWGRGWRKQPYVVRISVDREGRVNVDYDESLLESDFQDDDLFWKQARTLLPQLKELKKDLDGKCIAQEAITQRLLKFLVDNK